VILLAGIVCDLNSISKLELHLCVNSHLVSKFKFTTTMDSTLSDNLRINHKQNIVEFETLRLGVVRYALTQPEETKDWKMHVIFHTYIKCKDKGCKIIIDNESCINAIFSNIIAHLDLNKFPPS